MDIWTRTTVLVLIVPRAGMEPRDILKTMAHKCVSSLPVRALELRLTVTGHLLLQGRSLSLTHRRLKLLCGFDLVLGSCIYEVVICCHHTEGAYRSP